MVLRLPQALGAVVVCAGVAVIVVMGPWWGASADQLAEIPVLGAIQSNNRGVVEMILIRWDQAASPDPVELRWNTGQKNFLRGLREDVQFVNESVQAFNTALQIAVERTPDSRHTGTISILGFAYQATSSDGPSAGAAFTVGFIAAFKGEKIRRGLAMTGTIEPVGRIGPVGAIPDKIRAAAREGFRTVLIPRGQLYEPRWELPALATALNVTLHEVTTVAEAYEQMTGGRL
ncbi:MAG: hypothetical protein HZB35_11635 [Nitrospirae bacterium]|nr:hypothetical protein [Nitrospirota bacterium]